MAVSTIDQRWQETVAMMSLVTDVHGKEIDARIFDVVVALNVIGLTTIQSCEGHEDHGKAAPWVMISSPAARKLARQAAAISAQAEQDEEYAQARELRGQAQELCAHEQQTLLNYLAVFYQARHVPYDQMLVVSTRNLSVYVLENIGAATLRVQPAETQADKRRAYQKEMQDFAAFLKMSMGNP